MVGIEARLWWKNLPETEKAGYRAAIKKRRGILAGLGVSLLVLIAAAYESHIEECPITKKRRFVALTHAQVRIENGIFILSFC
jgi:hypothetical protein